MPDDEETNAPDAIPAVTFREPHTWQSDEVTLPALSYIPTPAPYRRLRDRILMFLDASMGCIFRDAILTEVKKQRPEVTHVEMGRKLFTHRHCGERMVQVRCYTLEGNQLERELDQYACAAYACAYSCTHDPADSGDID